MKNTKLMVLMIFAIFICTVSAVCATDANETTIATENNNQMGLIIQNELTDDKISVKTDDVATDLETLGDGEGTFYDLINEIGSGGDKNLTKSYYRYTGGDTIEINTTGVINGNGAIIDMINSTNNQVFNVSVSGVTIKNLTIKNAKFNGDGAAIYFIGSGEVSSCNFIGNIVFGNGGAVFFNGDGDLINCNFINNSASNKGGAVFFNGIGNVTNCNFTNNLVINDGGAVYFRDDCEVRNSNFNNNKATAVDGYGGAVRMNFGIVENCNFTNNRAARGGAAYLWYAGEVSNCKFTNNKVTEFGGALCFLGFYDKGNVVNCIFDNNSANSGGAIVSINNLEVTVDTCIFITDVDTTFNTQNLSPSLNVDNFTTVYNSGEKLTFDLKTNSSIPVANGNISIRVYFKDNGEWVGNYSCLSGEGWIPDLLVGSYHAIFDTAYAEFQPINRTITIMMPVGKYHINVTSFTTNNKTVNITAKTNIPKNSTWDAKLLFILPNGSEINANYGANGTWWAEHAFGDYGEYNVSASFVGWDNVTVNNGTITINKVNSTITLENITLDYAESANVTVTTTGAVGITAKIDGKDVAVINNYTIPVSGLGAGNYTLTVTTIPDKDHNPVTASSKITVNKADSTLTVGNIVFDYDSEGSGDVSFTGASEVIANVVNQPSAVVNVTGKKIAVSGLAAGTYTLNVTTVPDENHTAVTKTSTITVNRINSTLTVGNVELDYGETKNITATAEGATGITAKINGVNATVNDYTIAVSGLGAGNYTLTVTTISDDNHNPVTVTSKITVNKLSTEITLANETLDLKVNDDFAVLANLTPAGAGNPTYSYSNESVVKVSDEGLITALGKGTSTVTVSFAGNENYTAAQNKTINVTVILNDASISAEDITLVAGANATINAVSVPEGLKVTYIPDNSGVVTVENGVVTAVKEGTATVTLKVGGDGVYALNSTTIAVKVNKMLTKFADVVVDGNNVSLILKDAYGNAIPNANISYTINGVSNTTVSDANGSFVIVGEPEALIVVDYSGSDVYVPSNFSVKLAPVVVRQSSVIVGNNFTQYAVDYNAGERGQNFTVQLVDVKGNVLANKTVLIGYNGKTLERITNATGHASVQINLRDKNRLTFAVTFLGDKEYNATMSVYLITINQKPVTISAAAKTYKASAKTKKYTVTLKTIKGSSADGKTYFAAGKKVTMKINGKTYTAKTNAKGQATFSLKITKKGKFTATVKYAGDNTYKSASKNVKITIK